MASDETAATRSTVRLTPSGTGEIHVETGVPVLDGLLEHVARYGHFDLTLAIASDSAEAQVVSSGRALGAALASLLQAEGARGHGAGYIPSAEALAHVALDRSDDPCLVSNFDLSAAHIGGLAGDMAVRFLRELAQAAGIVLHVRLVEGSDTQHVLDAIFKALGVALRSACSVRGETR
ncbi:MAG: imidazoleglycerol-phosphate dehydratase [Gaiellaceae bacterium]|jgi:imidazoleglycerol-phosphate dehydratase